jgi:signal transduction histidine kinase/CheY-like chemotaxis protein
MPAREISNTKCAIIAFGSVLAAVIVRALIDYVSEEEIPYTAFYPAVMATALCCGLYWGLAATGLSAVSSMYWISPRGRLQIGVDTGDLPRMAMFLLVCALVVWLADRVHRHRREAERSAEERQLLLVREQAARKEAERANRAKDEFLATVTHELRTPLQSILGWTQLLQLKGLDGEQAEVALKSIERSVKIQSQLINDLLDLSRIVMGKLRLDARVVYLSEALTAALETVGPAASAKNIRLLADVRSDDAIVFGDPDRLHQVVWNLLSNAIKFTPSQGTIRAIVRRQGRTIHLTIADSGEGIDPVFLPKVFERFQQTKSGHRKGGIGLGLAIVKELVELHGGTVSAFSAGRGRGAAFTVSLPAHRVPAIAGEASLSGRAATGFVSQPLTGRRVLVVEDDAEAADIIHQVLERHGAEVIPASSAEEAALLLQRERPDVLLSDLGLPGEDGLQLVRHLRRQSEEGLARIPAVALTGRTREVDQFQAIESGFQVHLGKPVASGKLVSTLAELSAPGDKQGSDEVIGIG